MIIIGCDSNSTVNSKIFKDKFEGIWVSDTIDYFDSEVKMQYRSVDNMTKDLVKEIKNIGLLSIEKNDTGYTVIFATDYIPRIFSDDSHEKLMRETKELRETASLNLCNKALTKGNAVAISEGNTLKVQNQKVGEVSIDGKNGPWQDIIVSFDLVYNENNRTLQITNYEEKLSLSGSVKDKTYLGYRFTKANTFKKFTDEEYKDWKSNIWEQMLDFVQK